MTGTDSRRVPEASSALLADEIAAEQAHVDLVYAELAKANERAGQVEADGLARGRTDRVGAAREEELTGLFERDALVFHAARRRNALETQYEGLVFGRLDMEHPPTSGAGNGGRPEREVRYVGRLGVRDDDYEPLVIDWRAPAASPFYRATPVEPMGVLRRRVLRCKGSDVVGIEDDLMVAEAPEDLVVIGDGALLAALTRSRGHRMRDIVATIQKHQDEAIRADARGVTEITGGPGTGKTVVALHRAAYLLYADRRRFESGGILVVGPSAAYTSYIERVLPSLGEDTVTLRPLGEVVDAVSTQRLDPPAAAALKGSLRIREVLVRAAQDAVPGAPDELRVIVAGAAVRLDRRVLDQVRSRALRQHPRNLARPAVTHLLAEAAFRSSGHAERDEFITRFHDHPDVEAFLESWWPQLDPREVLLWLADEDRLGRYAAGVLGPQETAVLLASMQTALDTGTWSVADVALVDELAARLGPVQEAPREERGFYEIEELEDLTSFAVSSGSARLTDQGMGPRWEPARPAYTTTPTDARDRLLAGTMGATPGGSPWRTHAEYAHVLVDEAQDLSPMQWRMLGRRGRYASWTVVGDAAQSSWPDAAESAVARDEAFGSQPRRVFHMSTNYRNAREIFDRAAAMIRQVVPDADIPTAVRETGVEPVEAPLGPDVHSSVGAALGRLLDEVEGTIAVIAPAVHAAPLGALADRPDGRIVVTDAMSTKGLEYDATVVVDPDAITAESPGGARVLYVAMTRAAHRMTVLR